MHAVNCIRMVLLEGDLPVAKSKAKHKTHHGVGIKEVVKEHFGVDLNIQHIRRVLRLLLEKFEVEVQGHASRYTVPLFGLTSNGKAEAKKDLNQYKLTKAKQ